VDLEDALLALALGFAFILIAGPIIGVMLLSLVDVLGREDIGLSKLVWLGVIFAVPLMGMAVYWLFRPKDFDPLNEQKPAVPSLPSARRLGGPQVTYAAAPAAAAATPSAPRTLTPALEGGADPEDDDDTGNTAA